MHAYISFCIHEMKLHFWRFRKNEFEWSYKTDLIMHIDYHLNLHLNIFVNMHDECNEQELQSFYIQTFNIQGNRIDATPTIVLHKNKIN